MQIRISEPNNNLDFITLYNKVERLVVGKKNNGDDYSLKDFICDKFTDRTYLFHKFREDGYIENSFIQNYQERQVSLIIIFTMILITSLTTYNTVRESINRVLEDFDTGFRKITNNEYQIKSDIVTSRELYSGSRTNQNDALDKTVDLNPNRPAIGFSMDDCIIKLIQLLNTSNQNNASKEKQGKSNIAKYISIVVACLVVSFLVWNQSFNNNTDQVKDIIRTELEKYRMQEKADEAYNYYLFQKYSSMQRKKEISIKTDTIK